MILTDLIGKELTVEVTQDDIRNGVVGSAIDCPFARALRRALFSLGLETDSTGLRVGVYGITVWLKNDVMKYVNFATPYDVVEFIRRVDDETRATPVEPQTFTFTLNRQLSEERLV